MDSHKPRILVVDDEPVMRTITESVLAQQEFAVSTASSAEQAILMISEGFVPDLLLLDEPARITTDNLRVFPPQLFFLFVLQSLSRSYSDMDTAISSMIMES